MCGIMGYIGDQEPTKIILDGLAKHEYRGYDSAGIAVINQGKIEEIRTVGRVKNLAERVAEAGLRGEFGIGHTRWATHGGVTENNAHPHVSNDNRVVIVHNGIIENAREIRDELEAEGYEVPIWAQMEDLEKVKQRVKEARMRKTEKSCLQ